MVDYQTEPLPHTAMAVPSLLDLAATTLVHSKPGVVEALRDDGYPDDIIDLVASARLRVWKSHDFYEQHVWEDAGSFCTNAVHRMRFFLHIVIRYFPKNTKLERLVESLCWSTKEFSVRGMFANVAVDILWGTWQPHGTFGNPYDPWENPYQDTVGEVRRERYITEKEMREPQFPEFVVDEMHKAIDTARQLREAYSCLMANRFLNTQLKKQRRYSRLPAYLAKLDKFVNTVEELMQDTRPMKRYRT